MVQAFPNSLTPYRLIVPSMAAISIEVYPLFLVKAGFQAQVGHADNAVHGGSSVFLSIPVSIVEWFPTNAIIGTFVSFEIQDTVLRHIWDRYCG